MRPLRIVVVRLIPTLVLLVVVAFVVGSWYYSDEIEQEAFKLIPERDRHSSDVPVIEVDERYVTLGRTGHTDTDLLEDGTWGLQWDGGYGQVHDVLSISPSSVRRRFQHVRGADLEPGHSARLDDYAFPEDPAAGLGVEHRAVTYDNDLGSFPAWLIEGDRTWLIYVHGRGATLREGLRLASTVLDERYTVMLITYRNDDGVPEAPGSRYGFGYEEWRDLDAAVRYALRNGARRVVVAGSSMGGAIVSAFLMESKLHTEIDAAIMDSPALDLGAIVDEEARDRNVPLIGVPLPSALTAAAKWLVEVRFDVDWSRLDYVARADEVEVPVLLFHGTQDEQVPISLGERFAEERPRLVRFVRCPEAGHVECWNHDPARYEEAVDRFVSDVAKERDHQRVRRGSSLPHRDTRGVSG